MLGKHHVLWIMPRRLNLPSPHILCLKDEETFDLFFFWPMKQLRTLWLWLFVLFGITCVLGFVKDPRQGWSNLFQGKGSLKS